MLSAVELVTTEHNFTEAIEDSMHSWAILSECSLSDVNGGRLLLEAFSLLLQTHDLFTQVLDLLLELGLVLGEIKGKVGLV